MRTSGRRAGMLYVGLVGATIVLFISMPQAFSPSRNTSNPNLPGPTHIGHPMIPAPSTGSSPEVAFSACTLSNCLASYNWGGYAVNSSIGSVTLVKGTWKVPAISGAVGTSCPDAENTWYDVAVWIGIDGMFSNTVEQTGTSSDCYYGQTSYYAWYEFYPAASVPTLLVVSPGDTMSASVSYSAGKFTTTIKDVTTGQKAASPATNVPGANRSSAEWIEESAYYIGILALTHVSTVTFGGASATIGGVSHTISGWGTKAFYILMIDFNWPYVQTLAYAKAEPLKLNTSGNKFSIKWLSSGP